MASWSPSAIFATLCGEPGTIPDKRPEEIDVQCCASTVPPITVTTGATSVSLERCGGCGDQQWLVGGEPVSREAAFHSLAQAYRHSPLQARAARDRHALRTAARAAARTAQQTAVPREDAAPSLSALLSGWQVLGASA